MDLYKAMLVPVGSKQEGSQMGQILTNNNLQLPGCPGVQMCVWVSKVRCSHLSLLQLPCLGKRPGHC